MFRKKAFRNEHAQNIYKSEMYLNFATLFSLGSTDNYMQYMPFVKYTYKTPFYR